LRKKLADNIECFIAAYADNVSHTVRTGGAADGRDGIMYVIHIEYLLLNIE
jgi:hypothetical protein